MDYRTFNETMARLIFKHKLAAADQIKACMSQVTRENDIGAVLVARGLLDPGHYQRLKEHLISLSASKPEEDSFSSADTRPVTPRRPPPPPATSDDPPSPAASQQAPRQVQGQTEPAAVARTITAKTHKVHLSEAQDAELPKVFKADPGAGKLPFAVPDQLGRHNSLEQILSFARRKNVSDVHLSPDSPITFRKVGRLLSASQDPLSAADIQTIVEGALSEDQRTKFATTGDIEFSLTIPGAGRFRLTLMEQRFGWDLTVRLIPLTIRPFKESGLPESCASLVQWAQGMVLITGPLGSGKSSTLCTLVEMINQTRHDHIITIENPIEFILQPAACQITQRELKAHTHSQQNALRGALRQDPDILVISELRDLDSIRLAVTAAETGHLVLATMNTANATRTIDRLIDAFPPEEREVMRSMISESLRGVISQQLVPLKDGSALVPAYEVLIVTKAVSNLIRKNTTHQLESAMMSGRGMGNVLLDESLKILVSQDQIAGEEAFYRASNPKTFLQFAPQDLRGSLDG